MIDEEDLEDSELDYDSDDTTSIFDTNESMPPDPKSESNPKSKPKQNKPYAGDLSPRDKLKKRVEERTGKRIGPVELEMPEMGKELRQCISNDCENITNRPSGYCGECEERLGPFLNTEVLRCQHCFVRKTCPEGRNKYGVCTYELDADKTKLAERDGVEKEMRLILQRDKKVVERFSRVLPAFNLNVKEERETYMEVARDLKQWQREFMDHLKMYATFEGWSQSERGDLESLKLKLKGLDKVVGRSVRRKGYKVVTELEENELSPAIVQTVNRQSHAISDGPAEDYTGDEVEDMELDISSADSNINDDLLELEKMTDEFERKKHLDIDGDSSSKSPKIAWSKQKNSKSDVEAEDETEPDSESETV